MIIQPKPKSKTYCVDYFVCTYTVVQARSTLFESYTYARWFVISQCFFSVLLYSNFCSFSGCCPLRPLVCQAAINKTLIDLDAPTTNLSTSVNHPVILYLCYFIHPRTTMVIEPVEETLVNASWIPPWFSISCQGLSMMPNNWVRERNWGS